MCKKNCNCTDCAKPSLFGNFSLANYGFANEIHPVDEAGCTPTDDGWQCGNTVPSSMGDQDPWCMDPRYPNDVSKQMKCRDVMRLNLNAPAKSTKVPVVKNAPAYVPKTNTPDNQVIISAPDSQAILNQNNPVYYSDNYTQPSESGIWGFFKSLFGSKNDMQLEPNYTNNTLWHQNNMPVLPPGSVKNLGGL